MPPNTRFRWENAAGVLNVPFSWQGKREGVGEKHIGTASPRPNFTRFPRILPTARINAFNMADFVDTSPSSPGFDQPTTSECLDDIDWENPNYEDLAPVDWSALHDEIMGVVLDEPADEQLQPDDR